MKLDLTETDKEIILAYADNDMNASETGKKLFMSTKSVQYHLDKIKQKTGFDPRKFYGLVKLIYEIKKGGDTNG